MSDFAPAQLPPRASLDQLRKQAKDLLRAAEAGDAAVLRRMADQKPSIGITDTPRLSDAQFTIAREYGFDSWPKLVRHVVMASALEPFERIARDLVTAQQGDSAALARLDGRQFFASGRLEALRRATRAGAASAAASASVESDDAPLTIDAARTVVAAATGFRSWNHLAASLDQPAPHPRHAPHGLSPRPPFYRIDWDKQWLQPQQPLADHDWDTIIDVMRQTGLTGLNASGQMTDAALARLAELDHITRLNFGGTGQLTDEGLAHLARMPQLVELDLSDHPGGQFSDKGLEALRHLPDLRRLALCWQRGISDAGLAHLAGCHQLEAVNLLGTPTGDGVVQTLRGKEHLRFLTTGRLVTDAGIPLLHDLPGFKTWQGGERRYDLMTFSEAEPNYLLLDGPFTDAGFAQLAGLDGVFGLGVFWHSPALTPAGLAALADLPNLGVLGCQDRLCDDEAMAHIAAIPNLRMLMAQGAVATDDGFEALSRSRTLEHLWGRDCPHLGSRGFAALSRLPTLRGLAVSCKSVDDDALASLPDFPALTWLLPMDVPDAGFRHVGRCEQLEKLTCMYCRDTGDEATEHLAGLSRLRYYYAGSTQITDRSLEILGQLTSLEVVELSACAGITDDGLTHLARQPHLKKVSVDASATVTRAGIAAFPPEVHVDFST